LEKFKENLMGVASTPSLPLVRPRVKLIKSSRDFKIHPSRFNISHQTVKIEMLWDIIATVHQEIHPYLG